ncbi:cysteine proteinase inhibitor 1-like [Wolffia australiana]
MKSQVAAILLFAVLAAAALPSRADWTRIKTVEDYNHAVGVARFAVAAHNKEAGEKLEFVRWIRGYVDGEYYQLFIEVRDGAAYRRVETLVLERAPRKHLELVYFNIAY